jgi:O-acetyl-ADP-ribose deacetylase (regulator of RNase III)
MVATISREMQPGIVLNSIIDKYGNKILTSIKSQNSNQYEQTTGCVVINHRDACSQYLIYTIPLRYDSSNPMRCVARMESIIGEILKHTQNLQIRTLSIPIIGSGALGTPISVFCEALKEQLSQFTCKDRYLQSIVVCDTNEGQIKALSDRWNCIPTQDLQNSEYERIDVSSSIKDLGNKTRPARPASNDTRRNPHSESNSS